MEIKKSLFDEIDTDKFQDFNFWTSEFIQDKKLQDGYVIISKFYRKIKSTNTFKIQEFGIKDGKLYCFQDFDSISYSNLENMILELLRYNEINEQGVKFGLRLTINQRLCEFYTVEQDKQEQWYQILKKYCTLTTFYIDYQINKLLGKGNFARVYFSTNKHNKYNYAVKAFEKSKFQNKNIDRQALMKEIQILRQMDQKGIIKLHEVYENEKYIFLIKEYLKGGELFHQLKNNNIYDEQQTKLIILNLLKSLSYIHSKNVLHRDLKPENLILKSENLYDICVADFGLADYYDVTGNYQFKRCGTPGYVAPEVLADSNYDFKIDVFSAGVIMFLMYNLQLILKCYRKTTFLWDFL